MSCPNTLCAYRTTRKGECPFEPNLVKNCICHQAFVRFSETVDIDREFESGCGSYHQWQEIKAGDLPRLES